MQFTLTEVLTGIALLGGATAVLARWFKAAKAPADRIRKIEEEQVKLRELMDDRYEDVIRKLSNDNDRLNKTDEANRVTQTALLALLGHAIDGNNTQQMTAARDNLNHYLINH